MTINIYQINGDRDKKGLMFLPFAHAMQRSRGAGLDGSIYDRVFSGEVECEDLEAVYQVFNAEKPVTGNKGRSMSVSDIVEVICNEQGQATEDGYTTSGKYYCDSIGFKKTEVDLTGATIL